MKKTLLQWLAAAVIAAGIPMAAMAQPGAVQPLTPSAATVPGSVPVTEPDANYIIGPGDSVEIKIVDRSDFGVVGKVTADGNIVVPLIGVMPASNRTAAVLLDQIKAALIKQGYFEKPNLSVTVTSYAARYVTVLGNVGSPGLVPIDRSYRLSEILARVGGVREGGANYVVVTPARGPSRKLLVNEIATGDDSQDPYVSPGDKIFSPPAEMFYVSGQVKSPGTFQLTPGLTVRQALGRGGGVTDLGSDHAVKITRAGKTIKPALDSLIQAGDVVVVGERLF